LRVLHVLRVLRVLREQRLPVAGDGGEQAVDEAGRLVRGQARDELDGLADRDGGGHVGAVEELEHAQSQHVAVDGGHPVQGPVPGVRGHDGIDPAPPQGHPLDQPDRLLGERGDVVLSGSRPRGGHQQVHVDAPDVGLVEQVDGPLARLAAGRHRRQALMRPR